MKTRVDRTRNKKQIYGQQGQSWLKFSFSSTLGFLLHSLLQGHLQNPTPSTHLSVPPEPVLASSVMVLSKIYAVFLIKFLNFSKFPCTQRKKIFT